MQKIYKVAYYAIALIFITLVLKIIKVTFFEQEDFGFINKFTSTTAQKSYQSIQLEKSTEEVIYEKGRPTFVYLEITDKNDPRVPNFIKEIEPFTTYLHGISDEELKANNNQYKNYDVWVYNNGASNIGLFFDKNGKVKEISCYDVNDTKIEQIEKWNELQKNCLIYGITIHSTEEDVIKKIGEPDKVTFEDTVKTIDYKKLNLQLRLEKKIVYSISLRNDL